MPYTQTISISNQGDFAPQVIEEMGDTLEMQIQQVAARSVQFRGTWLTNTAYAIGDIVQDGANGGNTKNYYICNVANTSGTWATDLAAGDWSISVTAIVPTGSISLSGAVTGSGPAGSTIVTSLSTNIVTNSNLSQMVANTAKVNSTAATANATDMVVSISSLIGRGSIGNIAPITLGSGLTMSLNVINYNIPSPVFFQATPSNPSGTTSTAVSIMQGLVGSITPTSSGKVEISINGDAASTVGGTSGGKIQIRFGTGSAPANGAALTGTLAAQEIQYNVSNNNLTSPFCIKAIVTSMVVSTTYWIDAAIRATTSGVASIADISLSAYELK